MGCRYTLALQISLNLTKMKKILLLLLIGGITGCFPSRHTRCDELERMHDDIVRYYRDSPERTHMLRMIDSMWHSQCYYVPNPTTSEFKTK